MCAALQGQQSRSSLGLACLSFDISSGTNKPIKWQQEEDGKGGGAPGNQRETLGDGWVEPKNMREN